MYSGFLYVEDRTQISHRSSNLGAPEAGSSNAPAPAPAPEPAPAPAPAPAPEPTKKRKVNLSSLLGKVKKEKTDDGPTPVLDELEQYLRRPRGARHRGGRARVVEGKGAQVASAREDGQAVLCCACLLRQNMTS